MAAAVCALLLAGLCACAAGSAQLEQHAGNSAERAPGPLLPEDSLPPLPDDPPLSEAERLLRRGSLVGKSKLYGNEFFKLSPDSLVDDSLRRLELLPVPPGYSWSMYRFEALVPSDKPNLLSVDLDSSALPPGYWVAVADYGLQRWRLLQVGTPSGSDNIGIQPGWQPLSPAGNLYAAVLGTSALRIEQLTLSLSTVAPPPTDLQASDGLRASRIQLSWKTTGVVPDKLVIERATDPRGPYAPIATIIGAALNYGDVHEPGANELPYGQPLYYRIRAQVDGQTGAPSLSDSGFRLLAPPEGLSASQGLFDERIDLAWLSVLDADGYSLEYRPSGLPEAPWAELAQIDGAASLSFSHSASSPPGLEAQALTIYDYRLRARFLDDLSDYSLTVNGYRTIPAVQNLSASDGDFHDSVVLQWQGVPGVDGYMLDYRLSGGAEEDWQSLQALEGDGVLSFAHSFEAPAGKECLLGPVYEYRARAQLSGRESRDNSNVDSGFRFLAGPTGLTASDGTFDDHVALSWTPNPLADGYRVYRFGQQSALAELGPVSQFLDFDSCSITVHRYEVRSMFEGEEGSPSNSDDGFRNRIAQSTVQELNSGGHYCSAGIFEGLPAVAYWQQPTQELRYSHAVVPDPQGPEDWVTTVVDSVNPVGSNATLVDYKGKPLLAYGIHASADLKVAYSSAEQPNLDAHWKTAIVDNGGFTGLSNLAVGEANAHMVLAYFDGQTEVLRYAKARFSLPNDLEFDLHTVDDRNGVGRFPSLLVQDDLVSVSYYNEIDGSLCYARALQTDPFSEEHWQRMDIDNGAEDLGRGSRALLLNGLPAVFYFNATAGELKLARASSGSPSVSGDWNLSLVASSVDTGSNCAAALLSGLPEDLAAVSYVDSSGKLQLRRALIPAPAGSADWLELTLDATGDSGEWNSLAASGCNLFAVLRGENDNQLRFIQAE
ncbi:hypothetical protein IT575_11565 [bacterium]|nr:hypothetical protein [bacterium]